MSRQMYLDRKKMALAFVMCLGVACLFALAAPSMLSAHASGPDTGYYGSYTGGSQEVAPPSEADVVDAPVSDPVEAVLDPLDSTDEMVGEFDGVSTVAVLGVGPWFVQFDSAAVARAHEAADVIHADRTSYQVTLATGLWAAVSVVCAASGIACLMTNRSRRSKDDGSALSSVQSAPVRLRVNGNGTVTKRRKLDAGIRTHL